MPTYVYECRQCHHTFEVDQRITADPLTDCEFGHKGALRRVIQPIAVMFKGSGFHINDYDSVAHKPESNNSSGSENEPQSNSNKDNQSETKESGDKPVTAVEKESKNAEPEIAKLVTPTVESAKPPPATSETNS